jgi:hypothetical protein
MLLQVLSIGIAFLTFLVLVPDAVRSCIDLVRDLGNYLKKRRDPRKQIAQKNQARPSDDNMPGNAVESMSEMDDHPGGGAA